jgi:hypothetical protein
MGNDVHERIRRRARLLELVKEIGNISGNEFFQWEETVVFSGDTHKTVE